jgi:hypothetical protein
MTEEVEEEKMDNLCIESSEISFQMNKHNMTGLMYNYFFNKKREALFFYFTPVKYIQICKNNIII